jgi:membrane protease subunit HflC
VFTCVGIGESSVQTFSTFALVIGQGDAAASDIYAQAYGKNKEFFQFNRSLIAYRQAFKDDRSLMVVSPDSEFFQYFRKPK